MKIGIIAAMASEREQLTRLVAEMRKERHGLFEYTIGQLGGNTLYIMECGIGKVNAAVGASELMALHAAGCGGEYGSGRRHRRKSRCDGSRGGFGGGLS